jgi:hypothetical protein
MAACATRSRCGKVNRRAFWPGTLLLQSSASGLLLEKMFSLRENVLMRDDTLFFIGSDGKQITFAQLPPPGLKVWRNHHKTMVVAAVRYGLITIDEACRRYNLSIETYLSWYRSYASQPPADVW